MAASASVVRRRVVVHGLVQGVCFRDTCRRQAEAAAVTGWVRNEPDGTVVAELEGAPDAVERVAAWCRRGPSRAQVERIEVVDREPTGAAMFEIH